MNIKKIPLYDSIPKRLFTFGCSFTNFFGATWANILAYELGCKFYNFGKSGAGNQYISTMVSQADTVFDFNKNDLVIVSWTNIAREDRIRNNRWLTPGNIYTQDVYDKSFVNTWADQTHYVVRDINYIHLITYLLKSKTQFHMFQMCDIIEFYHQYNLNIKVNDENKNLISLYNKDLSLIKPSFYEILWGNNIKNKTEKNKKDIHQYYVDAHPTILEHFQYLENIFDYKFSKNTIETVLNTHHAFIADVKEIYKTIKNPTFHIPLFQNNDEKYIIKKSSSIPKEIFN